MSDEDYAAFLDKASGDAAGAPKAQASGSAKGGFTEQSVDAEVPAVLKGVHATYTSDADEAFEVVSLKWAEAETGGKKIGVGEWCIPCRCPHHCGVDRSIESAVVVHLIC